MTFDIFNKKTPLDVALQALEAFESEKVLIRNPSLTIVLQTIEVFENNNGEIWIKHSSRLETNLKTPDFFEGMKK